MSSATRNEGRAGGDGLNLFRGAQVGTVLTCSQTSRAHVVARRWGGAQVGTVLTCSQTSRAHVVRGGPCLLGALTICDTHVEAFPSEAARAVVGPGYGELTASAGVNPRTQARARCRDRRRLAAGARRRRVPSPRGPRRHGRQLAGPCRRARPPNRPTLRRELQNLTEELDVLAG